MAFTSNFIVYWGSLLFFSIPLPLCERELGTLPFASRWNLITWVPRRLFPIARDKENWNRERSRIHKKLPVHTTSLRTVFGNHMQTPPSRLLVAAPTSLMTSNFNVWNRRLDKHSLLTFDALSRAKTSRPLRFPSDERTFSQVIKQKANGWELSFS